MCLDGFRICKTLQVRFKSGDITLTSPLSLKMSFFKIIFRLTCLLRAAKLSKPKQVERPSLMTNAKKHEFLIFSFFVPQVGRVLRIISGCHES